MALNNRDENILQEIIDLEGNCLKQDRCHHCPFRSMCLPEFLFPNPPSHDQRKHMALKVLTHNALLESDEPMNIQEEYKWPSKEK